MALTKPPVIPAWAEAGDKVQPSNAEIQAGWPLSNVPPSRQRFNWLLNFLANGVRYLTRRGLPDWGAGETYEIGDRVQGPDGLTYKSLTQNTNKTPAANPMDWERWGFTAAELGTTGGKLLRITRYTAPGSGTWNKQSDTNFILVRAVAGGGGGGGGTTGIVQAGNGGYSGCYGEKLITAPAASYSYTVGAAGSGGAVGAAGSAGGQTSFGAMTLTGGPGGQPSLSDLVAVPTGSGWDFTCAAAGAAGNADSATNSHAAPGAGGASPFAGGGSGSGTTTIPGSYGSGGGGGPRTDGTGYAGSAGGAGYIEIWEFS